MKQGLVLIDIQNDYFTGGAMELVGMESAAERAGDILNRFRDAGTPVFHIQHISNRPGATFFLPDSAGAQINEAVSPTPGETVIQKHYPNSFRDTDLLKQLEDEGIEKLVICGAMSHMCIDATTRAAFDLGLGCVVIEDACATRDLQHQGQTIKAGDVHAAFMAALAAPYAQVVSCTDYCNAEPP